MIVVANRFHVAEADEASHSTDAPEGMFTEPNELEIHSVAVERTPE